jgi:hypothetical protein
MNNKRCYRINVFNTYPFYKINNNVYLFGSSHGEQINTIFEPILEIMTNCDDLTLECDIKSFDECDTVGTCKLGNL